MTKATCRRVDLGFWSQRDRCPSWRESMAASRNQDKLRMMHGFWNPPKWHTSSCRATPPQSTQTGLQLGPSIQTPETMEDIHLLSHYNMGPYTVCKCLSSISSKTSIVGSNVVLCDQEHCKLSGVQFAFWTRVWLIFKMPVLRNTRVLPTCCCLIWPPHPQP